MARAVSDEFVTAARDAAWQFNEAVSMLRQAGRCARYGEGNTELADEIDDGLPAMQRALEALADEVRHEK